MKKIYFTFLVPIFLYSQNLEELVNLTIENRLVESSKQNLDALKDEYKSVQRGYLPKLDIVTAKTWAYILNMQNNLRRMA